MMATPLGVRGVHFEDISVSEFGTPLSAAAPTSIDYVNAQLVAHGFAHGNGLNLSDLRGKDQQVVLKCLANMLGQRLDDMGRSEQLAGKYKTLSYDHERLIEQHRAAKDAAAQAERETEAGKAKVESAQRRLTAEEEAHRKTRDDLQRLKMAMQYLRTTTTGDIKRKEKEIEKMTERWGKLANEQVRLGAIGSGLACANLLPEAPHSEENSIWEAALADSEAARLRLLKENDAFRDVILACANALQALHHTAISTITKVEMEEPELILSDTFFVTNPASTQAETSQDKLRELFGNLREVLSKAGSIGNSRRQSMRQREEDLQQIQALQAANAALQLQLQEAQEAARAQGQQLLDQFVSDARFMAGKRHAVDLSMELMATPARDVLVETLEEQRKHLESERDKFTEATLELGREKAALEAERLKFMEEKRAFMVQSILDDLPSTPEAPGRLAMTIQPGPAATKAAPNPVLAMSSKHSRATQKPSPPLPTTEVPISSNQTDAAPVPSKPAQTTMAPALNLERNAFGASTTPPIPEDDATFPTSPTDQHPNTAPSSSSSSTEQPKPKGQPISPLPPHLRSTQTTPVRPIFPQGRVQHKYSPAVPSPLSRMVRAMESPPSSPESKAQKGNVWRPPVIAEEDEEEVNTHGNDILPPAQQEGPPVTSDEVVAADDQVQMEVEPGPGSLSPLSRILHMGLSPAIAPTLAISSFPGLLGTGSLAQGLLSRPRPLSKESGLGFENIPGGFQLGTAITGRVQASTSNGVIAGASKVARTVKTVKAPASLQTVKEKTKTKKTVFGENRPRSSKESTSSSGSGESGESRSSATSSHRPSSARVVARSRVGEVAGKENEVKRKVGASVPTSGTAGVKIAPAKKSTNTSSAPSAAAPKAPKTSAPASRRPGVQLGVGTKPASGKGWRG